VEYYTASRKGQLGDLLIVYSVINIWYKFLGTFHQAIKVKIPYDIVTDISNVSLLYLVRMEFFLIFLKFISRTLRFILNLSFDKRDKVMVIAKDLAVMIHYFIYNDTHNFTHERYRVQLAFLLLLFCGTGARAGVIVESSSYCNSN